MNALTIGMLLGTLLIHGGFQSTSTVTDAQRERARRIYLPSVPHEALQKLVGTWEQTTEYSAGGGKATTTRGTVVNRPALGGRFVVSESASKDASGSFATEAILIFGFDGRSSQHTVIVLDTFGTYFVTAAGANSPEASRLLMSGETPEGRGVKRFDVILEWTGADTYVTRIVFNLPGQPPVPAVTSVHRRIR
jgi:hypothetical protein